MRPRDRVKQMVSSRRQPKADAHDRAQQKHEAKKRELSNLLEPAVALVEGYFDPPNEMTWTADDDSRWEVVIRKKVPRSDYDGQCPPYDWMRSGRHG